MGIKVPNKESKPGCHFWKVVRVFVHVLTHISLFGKSCQMLISLRYSQIDFQGHFRVNQLCSLCQLLPKCGCMTVFGADFIEIFTD
jgi:hypothetical protein